MANLADNVGFNARLRCSFREAQVEWLDGLGFNLGLTLNFNARDLSLPVARRRVGDCFFRVDRKLLGPRFHKKPDQRTQGVFFFEHLESNIHCHGMLYVTPERLAPFVALFPEAGRSVWEEVCPSGSHLLRDLTPRAAAAYVTKEQNPWSDPQTTLWLADFHPA